MKFAWKPPLWGPKGSGTAQCWAPGDFCIFTCQEALVIWSAFDMVEAYSSILFIYCFFLKYCRGSRIMTIFCGCQTFIAENPCMASDFRSVNFRRDPHTHRPTGSRQVSQVFEYRWAVWSIPGHHLFGKQLWVILPVTCGRNWQFVAAALKERLVQQLSSGQTWIVNVKLQPFYFKQTEQLTHSTQGLSISFLRFRTICWLPTVDGLKS